MTLESTPGAEARPRPVLCLMLAVQMGLVLAAVYLVTEMLMHKLSAAEVLLRGKLAVVHTVSIFAQWFG